jgi:LytS/YehU family sensor histidine kinase
MRIIGALLVVWLVIGLLAGLQRHYYAGAVSCAKASTVVATIAAGPLNYMGANPTIRCHIPQPSK